LLPALFAATDASPSHEKARIVTVSSCANYFSKGLDFDAIADGPGRKKCNEAELYNNSKFVRRTENTPKILVYWPKSQGNVVVARELARRYGDKIVSTSLNPGNIRTNLLRHVPGYLLALIVRSFVIVWWDVHS